MSVNDISAYHAAFSSEYTPAGQSYQQQPQASTSRQQPHQSLYPPSQPTPSQPTLNIPLSQNRVSCACRAPANGKCYLKLCQSCCRQKAIAGQSGFLCQVQNHRQVNRIAVEQLFAQQQALATAAVTQSFVPSSQPQTTTYQQNSLQYQPEVLPQPPATNAHPVPTSQSNPTSRITNNNIAQPYILNVDSSPNLREKFDAPANNNAGNRQPKRPKLPQRFTLILLKGQEVCMLLHVTLY